MKNLILFYCFYEDTHTTFRGKTQSLRLVVKATSPKEAKDVSDEFMKEYHPTGYIWKECCQVDVGPRVVELSRMFGREYTDGMVGPI